MPSPFQYFSLKTRIILLLICSCFAGTAAGQKPPKHDHLITISTREGNIVLLLSDKTPKHKENFLKLTKEGFYNGTTFHRIIEGFMIQGGDLDSKDSIPGNDGMGGPGYTVPAEIVSGLSHKYGALAAARMGDNVNPEKASSGSQFYIVENHEGTPFLNNGYTVFGQTIEGLDVVDKIAKQPKDTRDRPLTNISMTIKAKKMKVKKIIKKYKCEEFYK